MDDFTIEDFKQALPKSLRNSVNKDCIAHMAQRLSEPEMLGTYRENLISYMSVIRDGKFKVTSYVDAVKYVAHKVRGLTNEKAYAITFPERIARYHANNTSASDISSYVSSYNNNKLVNLIYEQSMMPTHILNQDIFQKAINVQAELMQFSPSDKVRCDAANSLLTHLKPPEVKKVELDIGYKQDSEIDALRATLFELAAGQKRAIQSGFMDAQQIAHTDLKVVNPVED